MFWNIMLALLIAAVTGAIAGLGGHLASTKAWHKWTFWGGGFIVWVLIGIQTYRNEIAQHSLQSQLDTIQKNTEKPQPTPIVNIAPPIVNVPQSVPRGAAIAIENRIDSAYREILDGKETGKHIAFIPGKKVIFNVYAINNGPEIADDASGDSRIYLEKGTMEHEADAEKRATAKFKTRLKTVKRGTSPMQTGTTGESFASAESDTEITNDDIELLAKGGELMFMYVFWRWRDSVGTHYLQWCRWIQTPAFQPEVWHYCSDFSGHR